MYGSEFDPKSGHTKDLKMVQTESCQAIGISGKSMEKKSQRLLVCESLITGSTPAKAKCFPV